MGLCTTLKNDDVVKIGEGIEITMVRAKGKQATIRIHCDPNIKIEIIKAPIDEFEENKWNR
jgi:sRNA-binding carbon storage regulator CsrA